MGDDAVSELPTARGTETNHSVSIQCGCKLMVPEASLSMPCIPAPTLIFRALFTLLHVGISFWNKTAPSHCPLWTLTTTLHSLLEKPQHLTLAELGHYDSILPYLYHLSPLPRQSCQNPAISCLRAFAYAVPCVWSALPFFSMSHPLSRLNVTSYVKLSLSHPLYSTRSSDSDCRGWSPAQKCSDDVFPSLSVLKKEMTFYSFVHPQGLAKQPICEYSLNDRISPQVL